MGIGGWLLAAIRPRATVHSAPRVGTAQAKEACLLSRRLSLGGMCPNVRCIHTTHSGPGRARPPCECSQLHSPVTEKERWRDGGD